MDHHTYTAPLFMATLELANTFAGGMFISTEGDPFELDMEQHSAAMFARPVGDPDFGALYFHLAAYDLDGIDDADHTAEIDVYHVDTDGVARIVYMEPFYLTGNPTHDAYEILLSLDSMVGYAMACVRVANP